MSTKFTKKPLGFTLLEVLIALSILTVGSLAVFALMHRTIIATESNRNSIIAVNLAREGMELVRSIRDSADPLDTGMVNGFGMLINRNSSYIIDSDFYYDKFEAADDADINDCDKCRLYLKDGRYAHVLPAPDPTDIDTGMKRLILIEDRVYGGPIENYCATFVSCEVIITVQVLQPGMTKPYTLKTHLMDWR